MPFLKLEAPVGENRENRQAEQVIANNIIKEGKKK